jgi:hypothetical protein
MRLHGLAFLVFAIIAAAAAPIAANELAPEPSTEDTDLVDATGAQLAIAAMIGAATGAAAALADTVSSYGTVATIYAAQLIIPAIIVGGAYCLWLSERGDDADDDAPFERPARQAMSLAPSPKAPSATMPSLIADRQFDSAHDRRFLDGPHALLR